MEKFKNEILETNNEECLSIVNDDLKDYIWIEEFCRMFYTLHENREFDQLFQALNNLPDFECYSMYERLPEIAESEDFLEHICSFFNENQIPFIGYMLPLLNIFFVVNHNFDNHLLIPHHIVEMLFHIFPMVDFENQDFILQVVGTISKEDEILRDYAYFNILNRFLKFLLDKTNDYNSSISFVLNCYMMHKIEDDSLVQSSFYFAHKLFMSTFTDSMKVLDSKVSIQALNSIILMINWNKNVIGELTNIKFDITLEKIILQNQNSLDLVYRSLHLVEIFCKYQMPNIKFSTILSQIKYPTDKPSIQQVESICIACKIALYYISNQMNQGYTKRLVPVLMCLFGIGNFKTRIAALKVLRLLINIENDEEILDQILSEEFFDAIFMMFDSDKKQILLCLHVLEEIHIKKMKQGNNSYLYDILVSKDEIEEINELSLSENVDISVVASNLLTVISP